MSELTRMPSPAAWSTVSLAKLFHRGYGIILGAIILLAISKEVIDAVRLGWTPATTIDKVLLPDTNARPPCWHGTMSHASERAGRQIYHTRTGHQPERCHRRVALAGGLWGGW